MLDYAAKQIRWRDRGRGQPNSPARSGQRVCGSKRGVGSLGENLGSRLADIYGGVLADGLVPGQGVVVVRMVFGPRSKASDKLLGFVLVGPSTELGPLHLLQAPAAWPITPFGIMNCIKPCKMSHGRYLAVSFLQTSHHVSEVTV
ncbi:MAG: hypothetical protein ABWY01_05425 [Pseudoxanthomonas sp.]